MNKFAPKSDFLRQRALSLHRSGVPCNDISRMLKITGSDTVRRWVKQIDRRPVITSAIDHAEKMNAIRWSGSELPTLAFVPHIKLSPESKYVMRAP